jgi:hypothetical protein
MRFDTLNVRNLRRAGSLATVTGEIAKYKSGFVGVEGTGVTPNQQAIIRSSMEAGMGTSI